MYFASSFKAHAGVKPSRLRCARSLFDRLRDRADPNAPPAAGVDRLHGHADNLCVSVTCIRMGAARALATLPPGLTRERFTRVTRLAPADADARYGLGQVWRRDWLKYLEKASLERAAASLRAAVALRPSYCDAWLLLVPLLVEQGSFEAAATAAWHARLADPQRPEA